MNLSVQFLTMTAMAVMGIWVGISVDTYGRFFYRGGRRRWNPVQIAGDLLFWLVQGLLVFLVLLYVNEGDVRIYIFLALFCGYAAYKSLFQSFYLSILETIIKSVRFTFRILRQSVIFLFVKPVQLLIKLVYTVFKLILQGMLSMFILIWTILWVPFRWLMGLLLPEAFFTGLKKNFDKAAGIWEKVKNIKEKVKSWLFGTDK